MSKEAVLMVKDAEEEAKRIVDEAHARAQKMVASARADADIACERFETELREDYRGRVDKVKDSAEQIIARSRDDAAQQYRLGEALAKRHMNEAVKVVLQGVVDRCR